MGKIILKNVRCYSFHGCLKEESIVGSDYLVSLKVWGSLNRKSCNSDELADAIDYVLLKPYNKERNVYTFKASGELWLNE